MRGSSPLKAERDKRRELVPKEAVLGIMTNSIPADDKVWLINEAYRRYIPVSWLVTEILKLGIQTYELIGPPEIKPEHGLTAQRMKREEDAVSKVNEPEQENEPEPRMPWDGTGHRVWKRRRT